MLAVKIPLPFDISKIKSISSLNLSFLIHTFFLVVLFLKTLFTGIEHKKVYKKNISIVQSAMRVDTVSLPKQTLREMKKLEIGTSTASKTALVEKTPKKSKSSLDGLLKKAGEKKIVPIKVKAKSKLKGENQQIKKLIVEGNKLSKGVVGGTAVKVDIGMLEAYIYKVIEAIRQYWFLPQKLKEQELSCHIQIYLDQRGRVKRTVMIKSSGNIEFDQRALLSIKNAAPFPLPSPAILKSIQSGDLVLGFPI